MNSKTAKGLVSLITIIIVLFSILAGTVYYQNNKSNITANAIRNRVSGEAVGMERVNTAATTNQKDYYVAVVRTAAYNLGVNPNEAEALLRTENAGIDPKAVSRGKVGSGSSIGLLQVNKNFPERNKKIFSDLKKQGFISFDKRFDLTDPEVNAYVGLKIFKDGSEYVHQRTGYGDIRHKFAVYNGGNKALDDSKACSGSYVYECEWDDRAHTIHNEGYEQTRKGAERIENHLTRIERHASASNQLFQNVAYTPFVNNFPNLMRLSKQQLKEEGITKETDQSTGNIIFTTKSGDSVTVNKEGRVTDSSIPGLVGYTLDEIHQNYQIGVAGFAPAGTQQPATPIPPSEPPKEVTIEGTDGKSIVGLKITNEKQLFSTKNGKSCAEQSDECTLKGKVGQIILCESGNCYALDDRTGQYQLSKPKQGTGSQSEQTANEKRFVSNGKLVVVTQEGEYTTIKIGSQTKTLPKELADKIEPNAKGGFKDFNDLPTKSGGTMSVIEAENLEQTIKAYIGTEESRDKSGTVKKTVTTINKPIADARDNIQPLRPNEIIKQVEETVTAPKQKSKTTITKTFGNDDTEKIVKEGDDTKSVTWTSKDYNAKIDVDPNARKSILAAELDRGSYPDLEYRLRQMAFYNKIKKIDKFENGEVKQGDLKIIVKKDEGSIYSIKGSNLLASDFAKDGMFYTFENTQWDEKKLLPKFQPGSRFIGQRNRNLQVAVEFASDATNNVGFRYTGDNEHGYTSVDLFSRVRVDSNNLNGFSGDMRGTLTLTPVNDPDSKVNGMYSFNNGDAYLKTSSGPFGAKPAGWYDSNGDKLDYPGELSDPKLFDYIARLPDPKFAEKAIDQKDTHLKQSTQSQLSSQRFFADVERVFTEYRGLGYYSTLFFDDDSLLQWRDNVDRIFATAYLGTEYWSSAICGSYLDGEGEGIAYAETPQGLAQVGAHIEATRTSPIIDETGAATFIYKITFAVRNGDYEKDPRAPEEMNFNVVLKGGRIVKAVARSEKEKGTIREIIIKNGTRVYKISEDRILTDKKVIPASFKINKNEILTDYVLTDYVDYTSADYKASDSIAIKTTKGRTVKVFKQDQNVTRGSSFSKIGRNAIVQDSEFLYDEVCIIFDKTPSRWKLDDNELCNKIQESSGDATTLASLQAGAGGGRSDEINDF